MAFGTDLQGDYGGFHDTDETPGSAVFPVQPDNKTTPQLARLVNQLFVDVEGSQSWDSNDALVDDGTVIDPTLSAVPEACLAYNALRDFVDNSTPIPDGIAFPLEIVSTASDTDTVRALNFIADDQL